MLENSQQQLCLEIPLLSLCLPPFAQLTALLHTLDCRVLNLPDQIIGRWVAVVVRVGAAQVVGWNMVSMVSRVSIAPVISKAFKYSREKNQRQSQDVFHVEDKRNWMCKVFKIVLVFMCK